MWHKHVLDATFGWLFKAAFDLIAGSIIIIVINLHPFSWNWMLCVFQFWTACDYIFHIFNKKTNFVHMRMFSVSFCACTCVRLCVRVSNTDKKSWFKSTRMSQSRLSFQTSIRAMSLQHTSSAKLQFLNRFKKLEETVCFHCSSLNYTHHSAIIGYCQGCVRV